MRGTRSFLFGFAMMTRGRFAIASTAASFAFVFASASTAVFVCRAVVGAFAVAVVVSDVFFVHCCLGLGLEEMMEDFVWCEMVCTG